jgi:hypothetical protein
MVFNFFPKILCRTVRFQNYVEVSVINAVVATKFIGKCKKYEKLMVMSTNGTVTFFGLACVGLPMLCQNISALLFKIICMCNINYPHFLIIHYHLHLS